MKFLALLVVIAFSAESCRGRECTPGQSQPCTNSLEGGVSQRGYEACGSQGTWSECISVGACSAGGTALPVYSRCAADTDCGPASCAVCADYAGIQNPGGFSVCHVYCQADSDCAPTTASAGVTPRCILGQCMLLCRASSACPVDGQCLPWSNSGFAGTYVGFDGLCE